MDPEQHQNKNVHLVFAAEIRSSGLGGHAQEGDDTED